MKQFYFLACCIFYTCISSICMAKRCADKFENESGSIILEISKDTLFISSYEGEEPLAICEIQKVSNSFLLINSITSPLESAFNDMVINYDMRSQPGADEPTLVKFVLPDSSDDMKITIYNGTDLYFGTTSKGVCTISLNKNGGYYPDSFNFSIAPPYYVESNPEGQYFGVLTLTYPFEIKCKRNEEITLQLPSVTRILFDRYFINGEYIHLLDNGIKWRGEVYYRQ